MKKCILSITALLFLIIASAQTAVPVSQPDSTKRQGVFALPAAIAFNVNNGQADTRIVTVQNKLETKKQFKVYVGDFERDSVGGHKYYPPNTLSRSAARWITVDKELLEIEKDSSVRLTIRMQVPDSVEAIKEMKWAMIFIQMVNEKTSLESERDILGKVNYNFRLGVHVYQNPPGVTFVSMKMLSFKPVVESKEQTVYAMTCINDGDIQIRCKANVELTSLANGSKVKLTPIDFPMFPKQKRIVYFTIPKGIPAGKYSLFATADGGEDIPLEALQTEVEFK